MTQLDFVILLKLNRLNWTGNNVTATRRNQNNLRNDCVVSTNKIK